MSDAASDPFAAARANIRETVKWLVTAFAAMTAAVVGTSPLTGLGSLPFGERLYLAVGAGFIGLLIAAWVIAKALRLLVTPPFFLGDIVADAALREFVDTHAYDLMPSQYPTVGQVVAARKDALDILRGMVAGNADDARVTLQAQPVDGSADEHRLSRASPPPPRRQPVVHGRGRIRRRAFLRHFCVGGQSAQSRGPDQGLRHAPAIELACHRAACDIVPGNRSSPAVESS